MKETEQQQINETIGECLENLRDTLKIGSESRDVIMKLLQFEGNRIDTIENKIDLLMTERAEAIEERFKGIDFLNQTEKMELNETEYLTSSKANADNLNAAKKAFDKSCDEHLDRIAETEITPKALLKLGFEEEHQPPIDNQAGYLYYSFKMWGIELLSNASDEEGWYVFNDENQEIHNLRKLRDLVLSLNELSNDD